jgi:uncharacterized membrane protein
MSFITNVKTVLHNNWQKILGAVVAVGLVIAILLALISEPAHAQHWHGGGYYGGYHYAAPAYHYEGRPYVRFAIGGGFRYAPYYPYYTGVYDPSWVIEYVQTYDPTCNCYVTIRVYVDRFGNTYPVP